MTDNFRASLLMVLTMAGFAIEDVVIKFLALDFGVGQMLLMVGIGGTVLVGGFGLVTGRALWSAGLLSRPVVTRNVTESLSMMTGTTALVALPLSVFSSIMQAAPILATLGAVVILGEKVGWRRWTAIAVGVLGVMLIIRPGTEQFSAAVILAIISILFLALRDLATRATPASVSTMQLVFWGYAFTIPGGLVLMAVLGERLVAPDSAAWIKLVAIQFLGLTFYITLIHALRIGESSVVVPFRYTRLVFAIGLGIFFFGERPALWTYLGVALVVGAGLYTLMREARLKRQRQRTSPAIAATL